MSSQFQADPRAVSAGLMLPQEHPTDEPRFTAAGLFAEGVSPIDTGDNGKLLAVLCRLVSLSVGRGRMVSLIEGAKAH